MHSFPFDGLKSALGSVFEDPYIVSHLSGRFGINPALFTQGSRAEDGLATGARHLIHSKQKAMKKKWMHVSSCTRTVTIQTGSLASLDCLSGSRVRNKCEQSRTRIEWSRNTGRFSTNPNVVGCFIRIAERERERRCLWCYGVFSGICGCLSVSITSVPCLSPVSGVYLHSFTVIFSLSLRHCLFASFAWGL